MNFQIFIFVTLQILPVVFSFGQGNNIPIGTWRTHTPYNYINTMDVAGDRVYAASGWISTFYIDREENSFHPLSKINGLSDVGVSRIKYHKGLKTVVLGYDNGNIDLIRNNEIININDIHRKAFPGSKMINHIYFHGDLAYLSTDFGVAVLDLRKLEIKETYFNLGPGGTNNKIYSCVISDNKDSIFLATEKGIMVAPFSPFVNLMDNNVWFTYDVSYGIPVLNVKSVNSLKGKIFAGVSKDGLYVLKNGFWDKTEVPFWSQDLASVNFSNGKLLACLELRIVVIDDEDVFENITGAPIYNPFEAAFDDNGILWIADAAIGLSRLDSNLEPHHFQPNGPFSAFVFDLFYYENNLLALAGGYTSGFGQQTNRGGYYLFKDNYYWENFNLYTNPFFADIRDLVAADYNPVDKTVYIGMYGHGLLAKRPDDTYFIYNDSNSPLRSALEPGTPFVRVPGVAVDAEGYVWVTNYSLPPLSPSLHVKSPQDTWKSYTMSQDKGRTGLNITIDDWGNKWIRLTKNGILIFNEKGNKEKYLTDLPGEGGLPHKNVTCMVKDKRGDIWIGTEKGIAVYHDPSRVFSNPADVSTPIYDFYPLLFDEVITCIKVDGGNRKWIGTPNGLWLFNEDGTEVLLNFTKDNSPLFSDYIVDIEVHEKSGEVFIGTDKGIMGYRGTATEAERAHSNVKVFPNPVRPEFTGLLGISGLASNARVKITDIYGNLIHETRAAGGTAVWNVQNYNGSRAKTGIYLVFSADDAGEETFVTKIAVVE